MTCAYLDFICCTNVSFRLVFLFASYFLRHFAIFRVNDIFPSLKMNADEALCCTHSTEWYGKSGSRQRRLSLLPMFLRAWHNHDNKSKRHFYLTNHIKDWDLLVQKNAFVPNKRRVLCPVRTIHIFESKFNIIFLLDLFSLLCSSTDGQLWNICWLHF